MDLAIVRCVRCRHPVVTRMSTAYVLSLSCVAEIIDRSAPYGFRYCNGAWELVPDQHALVAAYILGGMDAVRAMLTDA